MLLDKFEIFLPLFAGLILLIMGILMNLTFPAILLRLLIVLVVFYIIGAIVKAYLRSRIFPPAAVDVQETYESGPDSDETVATAATEGYSFDDGIEGSMGYEADDIADIAQDTAENQPPIF